MNASVIILVIGILVSCKTPDKPLENEYAGFKEKEIILAVYESGLHKLDSFAKLFIKIPERFDTFFQFQRSRDFIRGSTRSYRFADSRYSIRKERPELEYFLRGADSLYQLTISQPIFISAEDDTVLRKLIRQDTTMLSNEISMLEYGEENLKFIFKDFIEIDTRPFIIAGYSMPSIYRQNKSKLTLLCITTVKKRQLTIRAECDATDTTGFINNMYKSFLSIRIKENP